MDEQDDELMTDAEYAELKERYNAARQQAIEYVRAAIEEYDDDLMAAYRAIEDPRCADHDAFPHSHSHLRRETKRRRTAGLPT